MKISEYLATFAPIEWDILEELDAAAMTGLDIRKQHTLFLRCLEAKGLATTPDDQIYYITERGRDVLHYLQMAM